MHFLVFKITKSSLQQGLQVAFGSCWVNSDDGVESRSRAEKMIVGQGWSIAAMLDCRAITRRSYHPSDENLQFFEQALVDGEVLVIYVAKDVELL